MRLKWASSRFTGIDSGNPQGNPQLWDAETGKDLKVS